jgi:hypothetical protein
MNENVLFYLLRVNLKGKDRMLIETICIIHVVKREIVLESNKVTVH